jgi:hypothetical protein
MPQQLIHVVSCFCQLLLLVVFLLLLKLLFPLQLTGSQRSTSSIPPLTL